MASQIVPLTSKPDQTLSVSLSIDESVVTLGLRVRFCEVAGYWVMTVRNSQGVLLADSIPMLASYYPAANLLQQQAYLAIGSAFLINISGVEDNAPTTDNLGTDFLLLWDDTPLT